MMSPKSSAERKSLLLSVEQIKADLETFNLVSSQVGCLIDLVKVNVGVDVGLGHDDVLLLSSHPHKSPC